jgi:hypothetical protein
MAYSYRVFLASACFTEYQNKAHTTSPYAATFSSGEQSPPDVTASIATRTTLRDDRANVPLGGTGWMRSSPRLNSDKANYFWFPVWTTQIILKLLRNLGCSRTGFDAVIASEAKLRAGLLRRYRSSQ